MSHRGREPNQNTQTTLESWRFVQQMLADLTATVTEDADDEHELLEGLRVLAAVTALCTELSVEADPNVRGSSTCAATPG